MPDEQTPTGYWAAFGYQNHLVPAARSLERGKVAGVCGVMGLPADLATRDTRPTCSVCAEAERDGRYRVVTARADSGRRRPDHRERG